MFQIHPPPPSCELQPPASEPILFPQSANSMYFLVRFLLASSWLSLLVTAFWQAPTTRPAFRLGLFDKIFEEEGTLGKGITVGKVQVALISPDRSDTSIFALLEDHANNTGDRPQELARLANEVCLSLMRKSEDWTAACSSSKWFKADDAGKAESYYNDLANAEAAKFEKEYIPDDDAGDESGGSTMVVVSLVLEIQGDSTKFDGAGYSIAGTKEVLASIASDCLVDDGYCVNAVEVFWTPGERQEVLTRNEMFLDFPELIDV